MDKIANYLVGQFWIDLSQITFDSKDAILETLSKRDVKLWTVKFKREVLWALCSHETPGIVGRIFGDYSWIVPFLESHEKKLFERIKSLYEKMLSEWEFYIFEDWYLEIILLRLIESRITDFLFSQLSPTEPNSDWYQLSENYDDIGDNEIRERFLEMCWPYKPYK